MINEIVVHDGNWKRIINNGVVVAIATILLHLVAYVV
jgi:hypothetical protein